MANGKAELTEAQLMFVSEHLHHDDECALFDGTERSCNCCVDLFRREVIYPALAEAGSARASAREAR